MKSVLLTFLLSLSFLTGCKGSGGLSSVLESSDTTPTPQTTTYHYFPAINNSVNGNEIYRLNTETLQIEAVTDIVSGTAGANIQQVFKMGSEVFTVADDGVSGLEIHKINVEDGTTTLFDLNPGATASAPKIIGTHNGSLVVLLNDDTVGRELFLVNPTNGNKTLIGEVNVGVDNSGIQHAIVHNGFIYHDGLIPGTIGRELRKTEISSGNTTLVADIESGGEFSHSNPSDFTFLLGKIYFRAEDSTEGSELWSLDLSDDSYGRVTSMVTGPTGSFPSNLVAAGGKLYFKSDTDSYNTQLITYNPATDVVSTKILNPSGSSRVSKVVENNGFIYFFADNGTTGLELRKMDMVTRDVIDLDELNPGAGDAPFPGNITAVPGGVLLQLGSNLVAYDLNEELDYIFSGYTFHQTSAVTLEL